MVKKSSIPTLPRDTGSSDKFVAWTVRLLSRGVINRAPDEEETKMPGGSGLVMKESWNSPSMVPPQISGRSGETLSVYEVLGAKFP